VLPALKRYRGSTLGRRSWLASLGAVCVASGTLTAGCNPAAEKATMEELCGRVFALIRGKNYEAVADLYDARFYETTTRSEWVALLDRVARKLGDLQKYELVAWNMRQFAGAGGTPGSGTYGEMQYKTTYAKYAASEVLTVFRPAGSSGPYRVIGHKLDSEGFLKE